MIPAPIRSQVRDAIVAAWSAAIDGGALPDLAADERPPVEVERPANQEHGDLSTNLAMKLARPYRRPPLELPSRIRPSR